MQVIPHAVLTNLEGTLSIRAGVVPVLRTINGLRFLLGTKRSRGELTDFGGGCKVSKKESPIQCAMRELKEELALPEIIRQIDVNINRPDRTTIIRASAAKMDSPEKRYWFLVLVNVDPASIRGFLPTKEISTINWYDLNVFRPNQKAINDSFVACVGFIRKLRRNYPRFLSQTIQVN